MEMLLISAKERKRLKVFGRVKAGTGRVFARFYELRDLFEVNGLTSPWSAVAWRRSSHATLGLGSR